MKKLGIYFYLKNKKRKANNGNSFDGDIYCKITANGTNTTFSLGESISSNRWESTNKLRNPVRNERDEFLKNLIAEYKDKINTKNLELHQIGLKPTALDLKQYVTSETTDTQVTVMGICELHINDFKKLVECKEKAKGTLSRYITVQTLIQEYLLYRYKKLDMSMNIINTGFINHFDMYLRTEREYRGVKGISNNSVVKYIRNYKTMLNHCFDMVYIPYLPEIKYKKKLKPVETIFLTEEEVERIENKVFATERLNRIKDIFLFSCYTGYGPQDMKRLTQNHLHLINGNYWTKIKRIKTEIDENVPLMHKPLEILEKYKHISWNKKTNQLLPIISGQKTNDYLKEIADLCQINKNLHSYVGRHTFAMTQLNRGVSIASLSKMMGHTSISQTQHYAKLHDETVLKEMLIANEGK